MFADEGIKVPALRVESGGGGGWELGEDGVDLRLAEQRDAGEKAKGGGEFLGLGVGVGGVAEPGAGFEHGTPLGAGEALFGGELAGLFDAVGEVTREGGVEKDDGLGGEQTVLGAAETKDIDAGAPGEVGGGVAGEGGGGAGVGEAGAIQVDGKAVGVGEVGEGADFGGRVKGTVLGGLGEGEGAGFGKVDAVAAGEGGGDGGGRELGGGAGQGEEFAPAGEKFRRAALVRVDVGDLVTEDALVALAEGGEREGVGGGAVEDKEGFAVGLENLTEEISGAVGRGVGAVRRRGAGVGGGEGGERLGAEAGGVVTGKAGVGAGGHGESFGSGAREGDSILGVGNGEGGRLLARATR